MINFYILSKRFFLKCEELSDVRAVSITKKKKKKNGFVVNYLYRFINSSKSISDE